MNWLFANRASIDCEAKKVRLRLDDQRELVFYGVSVSTPPYLVTSIQVQRLLRKGCQGFLCHVVDFQCTDPMLDDIPIVKEFLNDFPEELPETPVDHEIEFTIEVQLNTQPISKTPLSNGSLRIKGAEDPTPRTSGQGFYPTDHFTLECSSIVRKDEGWYNAIMYRL